MDLLGTMLPVYFESAAELDLFYFREGSVCARNDSSYGDFISAHPNPSAGEIRLMARGFECKEARL